MTGTGHMHDWPSYAGPTEAACAAAEVVVNSGRVVHWQ